MDNTFSDMFLENKTLLLLKNLQELIQGPNIYHYESYSVVGFVLDMQVLRF